MLVNMSKLLADAQKGNYAVGSFSVANMEMVLGVLKASEELNAPVILQIAEVRLKQSPLELIGPLMVASAKYAKTPVAVHFDHGKTIEKISQALELGFTSVMFDGSHLPIEENLEKAKEVVAKAHAKGISVEAEVGTIGGEEDGIIGDGELAPIEDAKAMVATGIDFLAAGIGNIHGPYPENWSGLHLDHLQKLTEAVPGFPIVLNGGSGIPDDQIKESIKLAI